MAKSLQEWVDTDVRKVKTKPLRWLSEQYFFRDPIRPMFSDSDYFFAPADGIILYQKQVKADECLVDVKGRFYSLQDAMRDASYRQESLVIGIFMTLYDVHINRIPYPGRLSYLSLPPIDTHNLPMLEMEQGLIDELVVDTQRAQYLHKNQRMLNRVYADKLQDFYYILQIADYDVSAITPFELRQGNPFAQNERFSQIRFGSQVDLIIPLSKRFEFIATQAVGMHVEAGIDTLVRIAPKHAQMNHHNAELTVTLEPVST